jgi:hypothetical protein
MKLFYALMLMASLTLLTLLPGCGGGGGGAAVIPVATTSVSGVAATGAPLVGTVYLKDSATPAIELSTIIAADGSFTFDVTNLKAPFLLKAVGTAGGRNYTLYSFASNHGIANINPFSHLTVINAYGSDNLSNLYANIDQSQMQFILQKITAALSNLQSLFKDLLALYSVNNVNFITDRYVANHQGLDMLFDMILINVLNGNVTITNKTNNAVIYTAASSSMLSGSINIPSMPNPPVPLPVGVFVLPASPTVQTNSSINFSAFITGTANRQVAWSVVELGGGSITASGVYTAPAIAGTYHVKATSAADSSVAATIAVVVTSSGGNAAVQILKSDSSVTPPITITINTAIVTSGYATYYSGTIQSTFLGNGKVTINSKDNTSYILLLADSSWLIATVDPTNTNKWLMIGTDATSASTTQVGAVVSMYNGLSPIFSGSATFIKQ